ncbi:G protein-coupled receptor 157 [Plakobranchus ocellatus]|uniref:G protein-coupled receptor 157 n=1 Tax=Plakobranchus ocellatus TaxID=259542 RepID=A0AAV3ZKX9_9GAST|nr:G protein-coupled receptor 157 [Plakobranchus ocellatus]
MKNLSELSHPEAWTLVDSAYINISGLTTMLSIGGCLVIIVLYMTFKEIRTTSRMLLMFLSIADIVVGVSSILQIGDYKISYKLPEQSTAMCQLSAALYVGGQVCAALWTCAVITYLFLCVSLRWVSIANRIVGLFHIFCWGMPVVVSLSAHLSDVFGYNSADVLEQNHPTGCWLSDRVSNPLPWYLITVEGWVLSAYVLICLLYMPITWSIIKGKHRGKEITDDDVIEELAKETANEQLRFIPVIYFCTRIWGSAHFLFTRYPTHTSLRSSDSLMLFRAFGDNSQGLVNAVFFCLATKQIRNLLTTRFWCCFICCAGCCRKTRSLGKRTFMRVPNNLIVKMQHRKPSRTKALDGSDLDISGISLDLPSPDDTKIEEDEIIFER